MSIPIYIPCECRTPYHCLVIEDDEDLNDPGMVTISFVSTRNGNIFHRIRWAFLHVFGREDLTFADIIVRRDEVVNLIGLRKTENNDSYKDAG